MLFVTFFCDLLFLFTLFRYQKQLQLNYVQMYKKNKTLESEIDQEKKHTKIIHFILVNLYSLPEVNFDVTDRVQVLYMLL